MSEHRAFLQKAFPHDRLRPKHHYLEHYSHLIKVYGALVDVKTMRFEGKYKFFKRVIREVYNFWSVPLTLADRHPKIMAYHFDAATLFSPAWEMDKVKSVLVSSLSNSVQQHLLTIYGPQSTVLVATSVIDGIRYANDMLVSVGSCAGLPEFRQIHLILIVNTNVMFICREWLHGIMNTSGLMKSARVAQIWLLPS